VNTEERPCPRPRCDGHQQLEGAGTVRGLTIQWWTCERCGKEDREETEQQEHPGQTTLLDGAA
jgi:hypothetical protein